VTGTPEILVAQDALDAMVAAGLAALPRETGGILAGYRTDRGIVVTRAVVVPDAASTGLGYLRRQRPASAELATLRATAPKIVGYVGEWHTHPADQPPSQTDIASFRRTAQSTTDHVALVVLPFARGRAQALRPLVGHRVGRFRHAVTSPAVARVTPTTSAELEARGHAATTSSKEPPRMTTPPESPRTFDLRNAFVGHTKMMAAALDIVHSATAHGPTIGDASEDSWLSMLQEFMPTRYCVTKGFVVDSEGNSSDQIDVIIHDRHFSPVFCAPGGVQFVPAESVYAVFEIKQDLSREHVQYAADKAASVRRLHRTSAPIRQLSQSATAKEPPRIQAGLLASRNGWAGFGNPLVSALSSLADDGRLDLGCVLDTGAFEVPEGAPASDMESASEDVGLAWFLMRLVARLNAMGTIPAIEVAAYTAPLVHPAEP